MTIEINGVQDPRSMATGDGGKVSGAPQDNKESAEATREDNTDTVELTDQGKQLSQLASQLESVPVVDAQKVDDVRDAVNNGSYEVDARGVAQKVVQMEAYLPNA